MSGSITARTFNLGGYGLTMHGMAHGMFEQAGGGMGGHVEIHVLARFYLL